MHCSVVKHLGSGRALKKWGKTLDFAPCFPLHFFRALSLPSCFTTEQSTLEPSLFVNLTMIHLIKKNPYRQHTSRISYRVPKFIFYRGKGGRGWGCLFKKGSYNIFWALGRALMRSGALICSSALILAFTVSLRLNRCSATKEKDPTILGSQTRPSWERTWGVFDKRALFTHFYFLMLLFSVQWYSLLRMQSPGTHSFNFLLSRNWHWLWFLVGRALQNNQLEDLPGGIFSNNTKLVYLWVDISIQLYVTMFKF